MAYQSLYRRYRSQNFAEIKGQSHVTKALQTAVAEGRHSHAYLFSGPRGTGKTSTARVLAKALNCENLTDGEPCGVCKSCVDIQNGTSFDLHELDAASNNKVDDIRELIGKVALGSPGRTKVYILDEVHMLTSGAENALLKTLEEPPEHVVFVLATTEPHKVVPTIRSRTQHFEFNLLPGDDLDQHLRYVIADAGLDIDEEGIEYALRQGGGSARDTLSALDLVAAAGGVPKGSDIGVELALAIGDGDAPGTIAAVERAIEAGREPRIIGETTVETLRNAFLASMGAPLTQLSETARKASTELADKLGPATITRSLEMLGQALVDMRQAPDQRVPLEVALLRLSRRDGADTAGLLQRIEQLEAQIAALAAGGVAAAPSTAPSGPAPQPAPTAPVPEAPAATRSATPAAPPPPSGAPPPPARRSAPAPTSPPASGGPADLARANLAETLNASAASAPASPSDATATPAPAATPPAAAPTPAPPPAPTPAAAAPSGTTKPFSIGTLTAALDAGLLDSVSQRARVRFAAASPTAADDGAGTATFAVPNNYYLPRCEDVRPEIETALLQHFGRAVTVIIEVDDNAPKAVRPPAADQPAAAPPPTPEIDDEDIGDINELETATNIAGSGIERLTQAFPGSQVIESFDSPL
ncbi:MAG: DNA polymerase III subunit gamma/tau [Acidimicrobiales bacterium]